jgi:hypothetical protein
MILELNIFNYIFPMCISGMSIYLCYQVCKSQDKIVYTIEPPPYNYITENNTHVLSGKMFIKNEPTAPPSYQVV